MEPPLFREALGRSVGRSMADHHDSTEEYLENILELEEEGTRVIRARLVERFGYSAPAVSEAIGKLVDQGYVELESDRTVSLTTMGRELATKVVRRHRLAERLLVDVIGLEWEKVHREADRWEHVISDDVEEKLIALLGDPATCPHGNPIPGTQRMADPATTISLATVPVGEITVSRVSERLEINDDHMRLIANAQLTPGRTARVTARSDTSTMVSTGSGRHAIPADIANHLYVVASEVPIS